MVVGKTMKSSAPEPQAPPPIIQLRAAGVSLVLGLAGPNLPRVLHWGADLGDLGPADLAAMVAASRSGEKENSPDEPVTLTVLPENSHSWPGLPGLSGHRAGRDFSTRFEAGAIVQGRRQDGTQTLRVEAADEAAGLRLTLEIELTADGLVAMRARVTNAGAGTYTVDGLALAAPTPSRAVELMDLGGHWGRERSPQRLPFAQGAHVREGRRGRTGLDAALLVIAGEAGFGFRRGQVWGMHVAWSGNHRLVAERLPSGERVLAGGELPLPGEIRLATGESYQGPWIYYSYGDGLDQMSARFHRFLRAGREASGKPRPVVGNSWEAVYMDHSLEALTALADAFAEVGIERFVLDDGWFHGRRSDRAGLGDWRVDRRVWPDGLRPLVDHVRALGMDFGLWVEPEMVNLDSDLARAHPEWIMAPGRRLPPEFRHQQVLNLGIPEAFDHIRDRLDALIDEYQLDYLKWDHNRDLVEAGDRLTGRPAVHAQTEALYRLWEQLKGRHPGLQIESCSSGGGRADLAILSRADRMWGSDCTDAHERQLIQRHTTLLVPPEFVGAHISAGPNHQTGRTLELSMRAVTAMFGDLGVEWNLAAVDRGQRAELARWIAVYKRWRALLHTGDVVRLDHPDPAYWIHGVVAPDRSRALFAVVPMSTSMTAPPGEFRPDGLDPGLVYRVELLAISRPSLAVSSRQPAPWWEHGLSASGRVLMEAGLRTPDLRPDRPALVSFTSVEAAGS
ncbi:MAG: alpha-galactosidase, partial [Bifidobacteriaceae bacterium]|nr:alpha-galactosidase [Bifidobacteriaceae bacterium]